MDYRPWYQMWFFVCLEGGACLHVLRVYSCLGIGGPYGSNRNWTQIYSVWQALYLLYYFSGPTMFSLVSLGRRELFASSVQEAMGQLEANWVSSSIQGPRTPAQHCILGHPVGVQGPPGLWVGDAWGSWGSGRMNTILSSGLNLFI